MMHTHPYWAYTLIVAWWIIMWYIGRGMKIRKSVVIVTMSILTAVLALGFFAGKIK